MEMTVEHVETLLLIAALVAMIARRFRFPYSVGLVLTGGVLSLLPFAPAISMTKELIFTALLPPLIFEAAIFLPWGQLRKEVPVVISMATVGVILSAGVAALGMHFFLAWPPIAAAIFGVLISATDPVSVIAVFKESGVGGRLRLLIEAESLFNDGTAAVAFGIVLAIADGASVTPGGILVQLALTIGGGIAFGASVAMLLLFLADKTADHLIEITLTTVAAYGSFLLAEHFHCSGVLATLTAGLIVGSRGTRGAISQKGRESVESFWEYVAFAANSLIFLLIGIQETRQDFSGLWKTALAAICFVAIGRAVAIYPIASLFARSARRISFAHQHIMFWGGLRGALSLALALGLPTGMPYRDQIVTVTFAVVAFSVIVQGVTMLPLLRHFGETGRPGSEVDQ
jgi:CPA1 family monovalent cation:H+ antiporter